MRFEVLTAVTVKSAVFCNVSACSLVEVRHVSEEQAEQAKQVSSTVLLATCLLACSAHSSTPKTEAVRCSETEAKFYQTTRCYAPGNSTS
jgi:hypothetical protein